MKVPTFFVLNARRIFTKLLAVSESSIKIKNSLLWTLLIIFFAPVVMCKQKLLHEKNAVQYLQNFKCYNVGQNGFREPF